MREERAKPQIKDVRKKKRARRCRDGGLNLLLFLLLSSFFPALFMLLQENVHGVGNETDGKDGEFETKGE